MAPQKFTSAYDSGFNTGHSVVQAAITKLQEGLFFAKDNTIKGIETYQAIRANPGKYADQALSYGKGVLANPVESLSTAASKLVYMYIGILNAIAQPVLAYVQPLQAKLFEQSKALVEETKKKGNSAVEVYDSTVVPTAYKGLGAIAGVTLGVYSVASQLLNGAIQYAKNGLNKTGLAPQKYSSGVASR
jgi:hypothetical protein